MKKKNKVLVLISLMPKIKLNLQSLILNVTTECVTMQFSFRKISGSNLKNKLVKSKRKWYVTYPNILNIRFNSLCKKRTTDRFEHDKHPHSTPNVLTYSYNSFYLKTKEVTYIIPQGVNTRPSIERAYVDFKFDILLQK